MEVAEADFDMMEIVKKFGLILTLVMMLFFKPLKSMAPYETTMPNIVNQILPNLVEL